MSKHSGRFTKLIFLWNGFAMLLIWPITCFIICPKPKSHYVIHLVRVQHFSYRYIVKEYWRDIFLIRCKWRHARRWFQRQKLTCGMLMDYHLPHQNRQNKRLIRFNNYVVWIVAYIPRLTIKVIGCVPHSFFCGMIQHS